MNARQIRDEVFTGNNMAFTTTDNATAHPSEVGPPLRGRLFATRFVDHHGRTGSVLSRRRSTAERHAAKITARGGTASIYHSELGRWSS